MKIKIVNLPLLLNREEIYPFLHLGPTPGPLPTNIQRLVDTYVRRVTQLARPQGLTRVCSISSTTGGRVMLDDADLVIAGAGATAHFSDCEKVTLLAATLGPRIDQCLAELQQRAGAADVFIFNAVAAAAAEHTIETLDALAVQDIRRNAYYPTARFSPGYGGWPLESQQEFVASIDGDRIGLSVTPHHLLQPVKSITAVVGWRRLPVTRSYEQPREKPCRSPLTCRDCPLKEKCQNPVRESPGL